MRDEENREHVPFDAIDRQRGSVEAHRALFSNEPRELVRRANRKAPHAVETFDSDDRSDPIDMAGDNMAAEFVAHFKRSLKIEPRPGFPAPRRGSSQGFSPDIDIEPGLIAARARRNRRQARPITGD